MRFDFGRDADWGTANHRFGCSVRCVAALMTETTDKTVAWSSSDNTVAAVAEGKVTAVKTGTATITATNGSKKTTCEVTVIDPSTTDTGVVINGVKWATRNLDIPGHFAATPEAYGKFYKRNRAKTRNTTDTTVIGWVKSTLFGDSWTADICPDGWRLPTSAEMETLFDKTKVIYTGTTQNSVSGGLFTDKTTNATLFLPAAGLCNFSGILNSWMLFAGGCYYWSSTAYSFFGSDAEMFSDYPDYLTFGFSVRCVTWSSSENATCEVTAIDTVVVINGVKWATRNVDTPGHFAATPEAAGKLYQWNRNKAWNTIVTTIIDWDSSAPTGDSWTADICPAGWRLPTSAEMETLFDKTKVTNEWTTQNDATGLLFTDKTTNATLFLPAAGVRYYSDGTLISAGSYGGYWSGTTDSSIGAESLNFISYGAEWNGNYRTFGFSVRCVAE
jgi:uncharacterized protein (TIGR02145 family)